LSPPYMDDQVKINLKVSRKSVLFLTRVIELGLAAKDDTEQKGLLSAASEQQFDAIRTLSGELLQSAGLTDMYQKLNSLLNK
jgi:hypothetical protein